MATQLKSLINIQEYVINVMVKVDKMYKDVRHVKDKVKLYRHFRWDQECINKYRNHVINVQVKVKLFRKVIDVRHVKEKKQYKNRKHLISISRKGYPKINPSKLRDKVTKYRMLKPVI
jgi:heterodisulfide reductase subunit B